MPCSICREPGHNKRTCPNTDEGMEDCDYCGYTHHYEDKCPNEATACHYKKWREDEEEEEEEEEEVCDDEQRSYGARGAPAPESDDEEVDEANCDDCGSAIRDTKNLDTCWTNDGKIFWCEDCREEHVEEHIRERDGDD